MNTAPTKIPNTLKLPKLSFWQIFNMNVGFFGIQYSFGLQQTAINPIYSFLGAHAEELPLLNLAGPVTGLLVQPLIGAISDKTWSVRWGRRKPFFLLGAIFCSFALLLFPFSSELWMAVGLLWILDAANNTAMEPYRAFIVDKLPENQQTFGFQMQSLFVGAGITIANFSLFIFQKYIGGDSQGTIPTWVYYSFFIGAFCSIASVGWSVYKTPENPPSDEELKLLQAQKQKSNLFTPFSDIINSIKVMPKVLWQLALVYLFQWYALFIYWQFLTPMLKKTMFGITPENEEKAGIILKNHQKGLSILQTELQWAKNIIQQTENAVGQTGLMNGTYNIVTMLVALLLVPLAVKYSSKKVHIVALLFTAIALFTIPFIQNEYFILLPMVLFGIGWASMMGLPYSMVSPEIPTDKRGVYMGIINMMIVIPMLIQTVSFGSIYNFILDSNPVYAMLFAGCLFVLASISVMMMKIKKNEK